MNNFIDYNIAFDILGALIVIILLVSSVLEKREKETDDKYFIAFLGVTAAFLSADVVCCFIRGNILTEWVVQTANIAVFIIGYIILFLFFMYVLHYVDADISKGTLLAFKIFAAVFGAFAAALVMTNPLHGIFFIVENGLYTRSATYFVSHSYSAVLLIMSAVMIASSKKLSAFQKLSFYSYFTLPAAAMAVQAFYYGPALTNVAVVVSVLLIYINTHIARGRQIAEQKVKLAEAKIDITLSQIRPHFIYNSLSAISTLCTQDPEQARLAIDEFAEYLRANLGSLTERRLVPFEKELEHTRTYLKLETLRFGDKLNVEFDIECDDFYLPALTVQPIVENAVRCGVCKMADGGTVRISSYESEGAYVVEICDNGAGFDASVLPNDGRAHIGISNVRQRLRDMCGGELMILSASGKGTTARINIPKINGGER